MIKTVSFAPPRAASGASSKPSSKVAARSAGMQKAKARATLGASQAPVAAPTPFPASVQAVPIADAVPPAAPDLALTSLFPLPSAPAPVSAAQAREQLRDGAPATKRGPKTTSDASSAPSSPKRASRKAAPVAPSLALFSVEEVPAPLVEPQIEQVEVAVETQAPKPAPAKRLKKAKVPVNLAEQYGQSLSRRVESGAVTAPVEEEAPKKRLNRAERAARRELMAPDDDLRARLHRAQNVVPSAKPQKRPCGWRFDCGRCGQTSYFETPGALCSCGALAIKE